MAEPLLKLARNLHLPPDYATQTSVIFGKRGSGKTNTAVRVAEQLYHAGVPFAVIDPVDVWWGLQAAGRGAGLEVVVFGGDHADLPLEATGGELLADVLVEHRISAVLSVRHFSGAEKSRFITDFARRLLRRNSDPMHLFLEEAHELAPQTLGDSEVKAEALGAMNRLWKLGRSSGIGGSAITQHSEVHPYAIASIPTYCESTLNPKGPQVQVKVWHANATCFVERTIRTRRWLPFLKRIEFLVEFELDDEVGRGTGSWKGGTVGFSERMLPGDRVADVVERAARKGRGR